MAVVILMVLEVQFDTRGWRQKKTKIYPERKGNSASPNSSLRETNLCFKGGFIILYIYPLSCCFSLLGEEVHKNT